MMLSLTNMKHIKLRTLEATTNLYEFWNNAVYCLGRKDSIN